MLQNWNYTFYLKNLFDYIREYFQTFEKHDFIKQRDRKKEVASVATYR